MKKDVIRQPTDDILSNTVKVIGSLKNTFGFFYRKSDNRIFGPHSWNDAQKNAPDASAYSLIDYESANNRGYCNALAVMVK